jgi:hypothetical protein
MAAASSEAGIPFSSAVTVVKLPSR